MHPHFQVLAGGSHSLLYTLSLHSGPVTSLACLLLAPSSLTLATTSTDSTVATTTISTQQENVEVKEAGHSLALQGGLAICLHLVLLPGQEEPLLVVAREDCRLHLMQGGLKVGVLEGHEDWVTCLASKVEEGQMVLASGGQDSLVRLWRVNRWGDSLLLEAGELSVREEELVLGRGEQWRVRADSVLAGHEGRPYSVEWGPGGGF